MKRAPYLFHLRLCLAILPALMLFLGPWAQGFAAAAETTTIVICSDGAMKAVTLVSEDAGHSPQECRDCPGCLLPTPVDLAHIPDITGPAEWRSAVHPLPIAATVLSHRAPGPLSRGPPIQTPWFRA